MFIQVMGTRPNRCSADANALPDRGFRWAYSARSRCSSWASRPRSTMVDLLPGRLGQPCRAGWLCVCRLFPGRLLVRGPGQLREGLRGAGAGVGREVHLAHRAVVGAGHLEQLATLTALDRSEPVGGLL